MKKAETIVSIFLIGALVALLGYTAIKTFGPNSNSLFASSEWKFRQKLLEKIHKDMEKVRILAEKGDHLQAAILLSDLAAVRSVFAEELGSSEVFTGKVEPTFTEEQARNEFYIAKKLKVYEAMLKLKYPKWIPGRKYPISLKDIEDNRNPPSCCPYP